ncbi:MAG: exodeoxyribonuclease VII large subunit, partial [Chloroflexi bacterium]|nr:exodeoxyribonuclease VII large subunit [Chloroflexota bacterium]
MKIRSVTEVTRYIKTLLDTDDELADLWIEGELSNFSRASSGHCYFTLKDGDCELRCVMWRGQASRLIWQPRQGDWVEAHGYVSVYERGGTYQFYADVIERGGVGLRWREFEELKQRLQAEGLFDEERKRELPFWPRRIGVVTSPTGAALQDILNVLSARYPLVEVVLSPSMVQGTQAPESLVQALERLNTFDDIDVILLARGGGSLEDLWAFNDERVVRAIAASRIPVVSGVGHEVDFTIADFVADLRAPTPSAAAAAVVPDRQELYAQVLAMSDRLDTLVQFRLNDLRERLATSTRWLKLHDPRRVLAEQGQRVDDLTHRLKTAMERQLMLR